MKQPPTKPKASSTERGTLARVEPDDLTTSSLMHDLSMLAGRFALASNQRPTDEAVRNLANVLLVLIDTNFVKFDEWAGSADFYLRNHGPHDPEGRPVGTGPRTRVQEADALCNVIARGLDDELENRELAELVVYRLTTWPQLRALTRVPPYTGPWEGHAQAVSDVAEAFGEMSDYTAKPLAKAALFALGCPQSTLKNLFSFRVKRTRRAK